MYRKYFSSFIGFVLVVFSAIGFSAEQRSPEWMNLRNSFAKKHPRCLVCGIERKSIQIHHVIPFSVNPELELDESNLITLCTSKNWGYNDHLVVGHAGNYRLENPWVMFDIIEARRISSPKYIEKNGDDEWIAYRRMMSKRCRDFNRLSDEEKDEIRNQIKIDLDENGITLEFLEENND